jgi:hypothetical protein
MTGRKFDGCTECSIWTQAQQYDNAAVRKAVRSIYLPETDGQ